MFTRQDDSEKGRVLSTLLQYLAGPGQSAAARLHCTPVPRDLRESVGRILGT